MKLCVLCFCIYVILVRVFVTDVFEDWRQSSNLSGTRFLFSRAKVDAVWAYGLD